MSIGLRPVALRLVCLRELTRQLPDELLPKVLDIARQRPVQQIDHIGSEVDPVEWTLVGLE